MASTSASITFTATWDGVTPAVAPAGTTLIMPVNEYSSAGFELTGSMTGTVVLEATINGATWFSPNCLNVDKSAATASLSAAGRRLIQITTYVALRARCSALSAGTPVGTFAGALAGV